MYKKPFVSLFSALATAPLTPFILKYSLHSPLIPCFFIFARPLALSLFFPCRLFLFPAPLVLSFTRYISMSPQPSFILSFFCLPLLLPFYYLTFIGFSLFFIRFTFIFHLPAFSRLLFFSAFRSPFLCLYFYLSFVLPFVCPYSVFNLSFLCPTFRPSFVGAPVDLSPRKWYNFRKQGKRLFLRRFHPRGI